MRLERLIWEVSEHVWARVSKLAILWEWGEPIDFYGITIFAPLSFICYCYSSEMICDQNEGLTAYGFG